MDPDQQCLGEMFKIWEKWNYRHSPSNELDMYLFCEIHHVSHKHLPPFNSMNMHKDYRLLMRHYRRIVVLLCEYEISMGRETPILSNFMEE